MQLCRRCSVSVVDSAMALNLWILMQMFCVAFTNFSQIRIWKVPPKVPSLDPGTLYLRLLYVCLPTATSTDFSFFGHSRRQSKRKRNLSSFSYCRRSVPLPYCALKVADLWNIALLPRHSRLRSQQLRFLVCL